MSDVGTLASGREQLARQLAAAAHAGQCDALGRPLLDHVSGVAERARHRLAELGAVVGLLHDVIEKTAMTREELADYGFGVEELDLIDALTQRPGEPARAYLERCVSVPLGGIIKELDLLEKIDAANRLGSETARRRQAKWVARLQQLRGLEVGSGDGAAVE